MNRCIKPIFFSTHLRSLFNHWNTMRRFGVRGCLCPSAWRVKMPFGMSSRVHPFGLLSRPFSPSSPLLPRWMRSSSFGMVVVTWAVLAARGWLQLTTLPLLSITRLDLACHCPDVLCPPRSRPLFTSGLECRGFCTSLSALATSF